MVRDRTRAPGDGGRGGSRRGRRRWPRARRAWRRAADGASSVVDGIVGALGPAPRPVVVPVPVRATRPLRPGT